MYPNVYAMLADQDVVWVGAQFGLLRFDTRTRKFTNCEGIVAPRFFLPLGNGHILTQSESGMYYYNGQQWIQIPISGTQGQGTALAIDSSGNLWADYQTSTTAFAYRFSGHVPPPGRVWEPTNVDYDLVSRHATDCLRWQAFAMAGYAFSTPSECQVMLQARQIVPTLTPRDVILTGDANGGVWWASAKAVPRPLKPAYWNPDMHLGHLLSKDRSVVMDLPQGSQVHALAAAIDKGVWLGTDYGLAYSDGETWWYLAPLGIECAYPNDLVVDSQGTLWIAADRGIVTLKPGGSECQPVMDVGLTGEQVTQSVYAIALDPGGGIWATHGDDLWRFGGLINTLPALVPDQQAFDRDDGECMLFHLQVDSTGSVWAVAGACGIWQYIPANGGKWVHHILNDFIYSLTVSTHDDVYALGNKGVYFLRRVTLQNQAQSTLGWETIKSGLLGEGTVVADRHNGIWLQSRGGGVSHYQDGNWTAPGNIFASLQQLYVDSRDQLWATTSGKELVIYTGQTWRKIASPTVGRLIGGSDRAIWVAGYEMLAVYDPTADQQP
jgi:ligand-binding sensor domain-containing protein